jgi:hypothetical protein
LLRWRIGPKLHSSDQCCQKIFDRNFRSVQEYFYSIDFEAQSENFESKEYRAKFSFRRPFQCFSSGHLRSVRATAWSYTHSDGQNYALGINYPWPHFPENADAVFLELWVSNTVGIRSRGSINSAVCSSPEMPIMYYRIVRYPGYFTPIRLILDIYGYHIYWYVFRVQGCQLFIVPHWQETGFSFRTNFCNLGTHSISVNKYFSVQL